MFLTTDTLFVSTRHHIGLPELQKLRQATADAEERLTSETCAHVWTQTGIYVTLAVAPITDSSLFTLHLHPPSSLLVCLLLYSVSVSPSNSPHPSRSETWSIATGLSSHPLRRHTHKWSYCLCNDRLIGSFGCLLCYCALIGAWGVLTTHRYMWATAELSGLDEGDYDEQKDGNMRTTLRVISQDVVRAWTQEKQADWRWTLW